MPVEFTDLSEAIAALTGDDPDRRKAAADYLGGAGDE